MGNLVLAETGIVPASRRLRVTFGGAVLEDDSHHGVVCFLGHELAKEIQGKWDTHRPVIDEQGRLVLVELAPQVESPLFTRCGLSV